MRISISVIRRIIREAVVDQMRLPRGPNSREDGEEQDGPMPDRLNPEDNDATHPTGEV